MMSAFVVHAPWQVGTAPVAKASVLNSLIETYSVNTIRFTCLTFMIDG